MSACGYGCINKIDIMSRYDWTPRPACTLHYNPMAIVPIPKPKPTPAPRSMNRAMPRPQRDPGCQPGMPKRAMNRAMPFPPMPKPIITCQGPDRWRPGPDGQLTYFARAELDAVMGRPEPNAAPVFPDLHPGPSGLDLGNTCEPIEQTRECQPQLEADEHKDQTEPVPMYTTPPSAPSAPPPAQNEIRNPKPLFRVESVETRFYVPTRVPTRAPQGSPPQ